MFRSHHDSSDDGDEGVAEGQQSVGGLGAAVGLSVGRTLHEHSSLLHLLLNVVLYYVAVVVFLHREDSCETKEDGSVCRPVSADCGQGNKSDRKVSFLSGLIKKINK